MLARAIGNNGPPSIGDEQQQVEPAQAEDDTLRQIRMRVEHEERCPCPSENPYQNKREAEMLQRLTNSAVFPDSPEVNRNQPRYH